MSGGYNSPGAAVMTSMSSDSVNSFDKDEGGLGSMPIIGIDYKKHEELKTMLDGNKDNLKLEAMKHIIGLVAKGKDCSDLFPAIVKNVVSKNPEIKKLVYVYLVRYAEEQQDLALLSISTFQKALKDPNQLIRASALRVLSSIRVPIIAPVMMLSIKESASDMSPYVRKAAAHAIPKLYSLDPEMKESLIEIIEKLLKDKTTLVAGSVVMAFESVCPERIDLVHKNYRKLVNLMADVDEWGQVIVINMLTRYARTQFANPNTVTEGEEKFYPSEESEGSEDSEEDEEDDDEEEGAKSKKKKPKPYRMDPDHRLLLRNVKPLLQSRNPAVVMSVAQLYFHLAPLNEQSIIAKPIVRLLKGHRETQSVVLTNVATISVQRASMFESHLKSFFVLTTDPTHIKMLKLEILTNIASDTTVHTILREFRAYISFPDRLFASATVQAIGRVACALSEVNETCLHGLMSLLSNKDENVVGESIVVIKKLLQMQPREHKDLIIHVAKMVDKLTVPRAKASVLWMIGEYCTLIPKIAPDVLRMSAKEFPNEEDIVKLQVVNLAAKLFVTNPKQTTLLCQYVMNMAKYDLNYDVRDRARFLRQLVHGKMSDDEEEGSALAKYAKKILLSTKPAPVLESMYKNHGQWQVGSLSHYLNTQANGYIPLPEFPKEPPDPSVREVDEDFESFMKKSGKKTSASFYSSEEDSSEEGSSEEDSEFYSEVEGSGSEEEGSDEEDDEEDEESSEEEEEEEEDEDSSDDAANVLKNLRKTFKKPVEDDSDESDEEEEDSEGGSEEDSEEEESEEESEEEVPKKPTPPAKTSRSKPNVKKEKDKPKDNDLLLLFDDTIPTGGDSSPSLLPKSNNMLTPTTASAGATSENSTKNLMVLNPSIVPTEKHELLNRVTGKGLLVTYRFMRHAHPYSPKMAAFDVEFTNTGDSPLTNIQFGARRFQSGMDMKDPPPIAKLLPGAAHSANIGINFNDTIQPAKFDICFDAGRKLPVQVVPPVGELVQPVGMTEDVFLSLQNKLSGMNESEGKVTLTCSDQETIKKEVLTLANLALVPTTMASTLLFAGITFAYQSPVLLAIKISGNSVSLTVNCEKMTIHSIMLKDLKGRLGQL